MKTLDEAKQSCAGRTIPKGEQRAFVQCRECGEIWVTIMSPMLAPTTAQGTGCVLLVGAELRGAN
jgi:hypothetical protein